MRGALVLRMDETLVAEQGVRPVAEQLQSLLGTIAPIPKSVTAVRSGSIDKTAQAQADLPLGGSWRVRLKSLSAQGLRDWLPPEQVEILYG